MARKEITVSEVKRYHVTEAGLVEGSALGRINVVLASDYDAAVTHIRDLELLAGQELKSTELATNAGLRVCLERDALQALLTAADERWDELVSAVRSINYGPAHEITVPGDDEPQYLQRKERIDWVLGLCDAAPTSSERSNKDYAIEHAEYMAKSADGVLAKFQAYGLALLAVDEGGDDGEGELFEAIDSARGDLQESLVDLRSMVYEFRKRAVKSR